MASREGKVTTLLLLAIILFTILNLALVANAIPSDGGEEPCGDHGEPWCSPPQLCNDPNLQACDSGAGEGYCYWCCADLTATCGGIPGLLTCQNDNMAGAYYDPDCTDEDLCQDEGSYWTQENSFVTDGYPNNWWACCDDPDDCVIHDVSGASCVDNGDIFWYTLGESSLCHTPEERVDLCGSPLTPIGTLFNTPQGATCCAGVTGASNWQRVGTTYDEDYWGDEGCTDGLDNDCDGLIDAEDSDCQGGGPGNCVDNDGDGYNQSALGCGPPDCNDFNADVNPGENELCLGGVDEDCDGLVDCADPACFNASHCGDCTDNDGDGYATEGGLCGPVDCDDDNDQVYPGATEVCTGGVDDDCDALVDCADPDCTGDPACNECQDDDDCPPIGCPSINGTIPGSCINGACEYNEPPGGCITECSDTIDNDADGDIDYPADECCFSFADDNETCDCVVDDDCWDVCADGWPLPGVCTAGSCVFDYGDCTCHPYYDQFDYDSNGILNYTDTSLLTNVVIGAPCPVGKVCDVNDDGNVDAADVVLLTQIIDGTYNYGEEYCTDALDNDCDALVDNDDPDCAYCGDGVITPGETCDGNPGDPDWDWGNITDCTNFDNFTGSGLWCTPAGNLGECHFDTSGCTGSGGGYCGDGVIQVGETCDGSNWGPVTSCADFDNFTGGALSCIDPSVPGECHFNTSDCNSAGSYCGDGLLDPGEECDDGNNNNGDGCSASCTWEVPPLCGNGVLDAGEECDDGNNLPGDGCSPICTIEPSYCGDGTVDAGEQCDDGNNNNGDGCDASCQLENGTYCGDGLIQAGEQCDGLDWGNFSDCTQFDNFTGGTLTCNLATCMFDTSNCTGGGGAYCGDGIIGPGEECDGTAWGLVLNCTQFDNFTDGLLTCNNPGTPYECFFNTSNCTGGAYACGNGLLEPGEQCDDGNNLPGDGCSATCTWEIPPNCGDGLLDPGEECDDGNNVDGDGCSALCTLEVITICGNGVLEVGEECDDGNNLPGDGCSATCTLEAGPYCGDGAIQPGEQCDGSNWGPINNCTSFDNYTGGTLSCDANCMFNVSNCTGGNPSSFCGNGVIDAGEQCDDGAWGPINGCYDFDTFTGGILTCINPGLPYECHFNTSNCTGGTPICGNGLLELGEECDDGNNVDGDGCSAVCTIEGLPPVCGDGLLDPGEQCDDGNNNNGDGCSAWCTFESGGWCGDGLFQPGEECEELANGTIDYGPLDCTQFDNFTGGALGCDLATCLVLTDNCTGGTNGTCGDGVVNTGEQCDGADWGNITDCTNFNSFTGGTLTCNLATCMFDTSNCTGGGGAYCGDGIIQGGELCDGTNWGAITDCTNFDSFTSGNVSCVDPGLLGECTFNLSNCSGGNPPGVCGDGVINNGEACDGNPWSPPWDWGPITDCTAFDSFVGPLSCNPPGSLLECQFNTTNCSIPSGPYCGDGIIQPGEECEVGNNWGPITGCSDFDSFTAGTLTCIPPNQPGGCFFDVSNCTGGTPNGTCGNGLLEDGEQCDGTVWGPIVDCTNFDSFQSGLLTCNAPGTPFECVFNTTNCSYNPPQPSCGNGIVEYGEACDGSLPPGMSCASYGYDHGSLSCTASCTINTGGCYNNGGGSGGGGGGGGGGHYCAQGYELVNETCVLVGEPAEPTTVCDADGDGYVRYHPACIGRGKGVDCDDHDPAVNPGARELCGDGKDNDCDGEVDEGCDREELLSYTPVIRVPVLSIIKYQVTIANHNDYDLQHATLLLELPSNWEYDGPRSLGTVKAGEAERVTFRILVSEDLDVTQTLRVILRDGNDVIKEGEVTVHVDIPEFAVRFKPSLDDYQREPDVEAYVFLNNKAGDFKRDVEVEVDVNDGASTLYVEYLDTFDVQPYEKFRYHYTYPFSVLRQGNARLTGTLKEAGKVVAESDDTLVTVYHPTAYDDDARTISRVRTYN